MSAGLFKAIQDKEQYFKKYDERGNEAETGSFFRFVDRIRILNTMVLDCIDTSELEKATFLLAHYPVHDRRDLETLKDEWCTMKNCFKTQPLNKILH